MTGSRPSTPSYDGNGQPIQPFGSNNNNTNGHRSKFGLSEELFRPPSRSSSPAREYGRSDHLAPRETGLPLFLPSHNSNNNHSISNSNSNQQQQQQQQNQQQNQQHSPDSNNLDHNSTNARRRTGANNDRISYYDDSMMRRGRTSNSNQHQHHLEPLEIENETTIFDNDDGGKGEKLGGYAMESMYAPSSNNLNSSGTREFSAESTKWDRLIPEKREPETWYTVAKGVGNEFIPHIPLIIYTFLSIFTRLYKIGHANSVVWDEAHFGKFGAYYLNQTFFFDVHPPLGKMLVGLAGVLSGFNGSYDFPSGAVYPDHVPYKAMRVMLAIPGILLVPLAWGTAVELKFSPRCRHVVTLMVLCDLAWLVISRFILLDSLLLFFTFTTIYFLACFNNQKQRPFEEEWWIYLTLTGLSIGCVTSVKWVGLFVTSLVGLYTAEDLWDKFGDLRMPFRTYVRHWVARILCLMVIPFCVYAFCFKLHFIILNRSGPGDSQMSSLFQAHLIGNDFARNPLEPAYGSKLTLKNMGYGGGLLHSHVQTYPVGSLQQQVTCYHYKDSNNEWLITPTWEAKQLDPKSDLVYLKHGSVMRLVHASTGRNLHSHNVIAPVSKLNNEISAYGNATTGDSNDYWVIEVVDDFLRGKKTKWERIHSLSTRVRFRHLNSGCYIRAANVVLPAWGFKQVEVSCDKSNNPKDEHTYWNIESHWNDRLPAGDQKLYRSPFFRDFWHLNVAMMTSNNALVPDSDKEDSIASSPFEWPFLWSGMRMDGWGDTSIKYYLVGNAVTWWMSSMSLLIFLPTLLWHLGRFQRKKNDFAPGEWYQFLYVSKIAFGGWLFHYIPFLIMGRVTYLHHYLPTLWFSVIMAGNLLDHWIFKSRRFTEKSKWLVFVLVYGSVLATFLYFKDTAFGIEGPSSAYSGRKWRKSWNIVD